MAKQNYGGVYANMEFPPYTYVEYPKHVVVGPNGKYAVVNNKMEEDSLRAKMQQDEDDAPPEPVNFVQDPEKEILISRAHELGVMINRKWSKAKLTQVVTEAEEAADSLPVEEPKRAKNKLASAAIDEDKEELLAEAKSLGINGQSMHLWGVTRLKSAIAEAKAE